MTLKISVKGQTLFQVTVHFAFTISLKVGSPMIAKKRKERVNESVWWQTGGGEGWRGSTEWERTRKKSLNESKGMDSEKLWHQHKCVQRIIIVILWFGDREEVEQCLSFYLFCIYNKGRLTVCFKSEDRDLFYFFNIYMGFVDLVLQFGCCHCSNCSNQTECVIKLLKLEWILYL